MLDCGLSAWICWKNTITSLRKTPQKIPYPHTSPLQGPRGKGVRLGSTLPLRVQALIPQSSLLMAAGWSQGPPGPVLCPTAAVGSGGHCPSEQILWREQTHICFIKYPSLSWQESSPLQQVKLQHGAAFTWAKEQIGRASPRASSCWRKHTAPESLRWTNPKHASIPSNFFIYLVTRTYSLQTHRLSPDAVSTTWADTASKERLLQGGDEPLTCLGGQGAPTEECLPSIVQKATTLKHWNLSSGLAAWWNQGRKVIF